MKLRFGLVGLAHYHYFGIKKFLYYYFYFSKLKEELIKYEKSGLVQGFEFTFELAWKTLKDYLEYEEVNVKFPRDVIKEALKYELITDGEVWMDILEKRNLIAHTYNVEKANIAVNLIKEVFSEAITKVYEILKRKNNEIRFK